MSDQQPFDQSLYDAVIAARPDPTACMTVHEVAVWYGGYLKAAERAARIAAERQPVPVSDEELHTIFMTEYQRHARDPAMDAMFDDDYDAAVLECDKAAIRAVRAAAFTHGRHRACGTGP